MTFDYRKSAAHLVRLYAEMEDAKPGKARQLAKAKLDGATEALDRLGAVSVTPTGVYMAVMDAFREVGARPVASPFNPERKGWSADVVLAVMRNLGWVA